ncbi:hypothetical protein [Spiroplasma phoeniceum]
MIKLVLLVAAIAIFGTGFYYCYY